MNLNLYDENLNRISIIGMQYISCLWSEGYNSVESFSLEVNATDEYKKKIREDCYVGRTDRKTLMVIKSVEFYENTIVATGKQSTRVLDDVAFVGTIQTGAVIDTALNDAYNNSNKYRNLNYRLTGLPDVFNHQISNKSMLELCKNMCESVDSGFRIIKNENEMLLELYKPSQNPNLIFSKEYGNLIFKNLVTSSEAYKNYAIVLGEGEGNSRKRVYIDVSGGKDRREIIIDARDITMEDGESESNYEKRLETRGFEKLLDLNQTLKCEFVPSANDFGTKYDLGDVITVRLTDYKIVLNARIVRFSQKSQNNRIETTVEVGKITRSAMR